MKLLVLLTLLLAAEWGGASIYLWISVIVLPTISGVVSWFAGRRTRNNDTLQKLQSTVDMLVAKNGQLYEKITEQNRIISELNKKNDKLDSQLTEVRRENAELKAGQEKMSVQLEKVQKENSGLKKQLNIFIKRRKDNLEKEIA